MVAFSGCTAVNVEELSGDRREQDCQMKLQHMGFVLQRAVAKRGVMGTLTAAPGKIMSRLSRGSKPSKQFNPVHPFDAEHGTDTSGLIAAEELLDSRHKKNIHNTGFYATAPSMFHQALARMQIDFECFTFIDLGAGKGRVMLLASNFPFQRVLGVEFIPQLQAIATRNISLYQPAARRCQDVECLLSDVRDFVFPPGPLVIFMWHPFVGPVFERVMENLEESLRRDPREVYVVYLRPDFEHLVARIPALHKTWESRFTMTDEDFAAYIFPDQSEVCVAYGTSILVGGSLPAVKTGRATNLQATR
jgi:SAM-dependent methyltransferase